MPRKLTKENHPSKNDYKQVLAKLATFLKQSEHGVEADSEAHVDLTYSLEKLARQSLADDDKQKSAAYFKVAVQNLRHFAQIKHDEAQELNLCYSAGQTYALLGLMEEAAESYEQALTLSKKLNDHKSHGRALRSLAISSCGAASGKTPSPVLSTVAKSARITAKRWMKLTR